jgi:hypothetical protein
MSQETTMKYGILPPADSDAAETLYREWERTQAALQAFLTRVQGTGKARRLAPGVWAVVPAPESFNEVTPAPPPAEEA